MGGIHHTNYENLLKYEKPEKIRLFIDTNAPETRKNNNLKALDIELGVTIYGSVININRKGETELLKEGEISCNSDYAIFDFKYSPF